MLSLLPGVSLPGDLVPPVTERECKVPEVLELASFLQLPECRPAPAKVSGGTGRCFNPEFDEIEG